MLKFYNNHKLEEEITVDFTTATIVVYKNNSVCISLYSDSNMIKIYTDDKKGIQKILTKILYQYSDSVYINLNRIQEYDNGQIRFDNGAIYHFNDDLAIDYKINFESSWRSFKITNFYKNNNDTNG